jgi:(S)-ureidoglycine aminohydrolase
MKTSLGLTRTVVRPHYALIAPDGHVPSALPGWTRCVSNVILSAAIGAKLVQWLVTMENGGRGEGELFGFEMFVYVIEGKATVNKIALASGGYAYLPPGTKFDIASKKANTKLLIFRKRYEPLAGTEAPVFFTGRASEAEEVPFLGNPRARLKTLIPDTPGAEMAVNIFTYDPGATLPFVETHVMEHGMLFLSGSGVYRLGDDWHPVDTGDCLWIAPYCPQWFIAAGPGPACYIYYKDVNRNPL